MLWKMNRSKNGSGIFTRLDPSRHSGADEGNQNDRCEYLDHGWTVAENVSIHQARQGSATSYVPFKTKTTPSAAT